MARERGVTPKCSRYVYPTFLATFVLEGMRGRCENGGVSSSPKSRIALRTIRNLHVGVWVCGCVGCGRTHASELSMGRTASASPCTTYAGHRENGNAAWLAASCSSIGSPPPSSAGPAETRSNACVPRRGS